MTRAWLLRLIALSLVALVGIAACPGGGEKKKAARPAPARKHKPVVKKPAHEPHEHGHTHDGDGDHHHHPHPHPHLGGPGGHHHPF
jgi:ABC-type nickel/cobalt efflux system permease component RcnA